MENPITSTDAGRGLKIKQLGPFTFVGSECQVWGVSTYDKCDFRCLYCFAAAQGKSTPKLNKQEIRDAVENFAIHGDNKPVLLGVFSECYPSMEMDHELTRTMIEELTRHQVHFHLVTKSPLVRRDIDLLKDNPYLIQVAISIINSDEDFVAYHEPGAPSYHQRLRTIVHLHDAGVPVMANLSPWIPGLVNVEEVIADLPEEVPVQVAVLTLGENVSGKPSEIVFGRSESSAARIYGKNQNQEDINIAYLKEYKRLFGKLKKNVRWGPLPGQGTNFSAWLKPSDIAHLRKEQ